MVINMYIIYALAALLIIAGDRASKLWIEANVALGETFAHLPLFDFTYVRNEGAAFSMLSGRMGLLSIVSIVFCLFVIGYFIVKKPKKKLWCTALTFMFAGAFGNAWDRIQYGYVTDFIETTFMNFAIFNIADIAITVGAILMMIQVIFFDKEEKV